MFDEGKQVFPIVPEVQAWAYQVHTWNGMCWAYVIFDYHWTTSSHKYMWYTLYLTYIPGYLCHYIIHSVRVLPYIQLLSLRIRKIVIDLTHIIRINLHKLYQQLLILIVLVQANLTVKYLLWRLCVDFLLNAYVIHWVIPICIPVTLNDLW